MAEYDDLAERVAAQADMAALDAFHSAPPEARQVTAELRAIVADTAATGAMRHEWRVVRPVLSHMLTAAVEAMAAADAARDPVGPPRPSHAAELVDALEGFEDNPPFTIQRLCELLLEPGKHYARAPKLHHALEKLLNVTSTAPAGAEAAAAAAAARAARAAAADAAARGAPASGSGASSDRGGGSPSEGLEGPALLIDPLRTGDAAEFRLFSGVGGMDAAPAMPPDARAQPPPAPAEAAAASEPGAPEPIATDEAPPADVAAAHGGGAPAGAG